MLLVANYYFLKVQTRTYLKTYNSVLIIYSLFYPLYSTLNKRIIFFTPIMR